MRSALARGPGARLAIGLAIGLALGIAACGDDGGATDAADVADTGDALDAEDGAEVTDAGDATETHDDAEVDTAPAAPWYERAVMYEVFVRSFQDSDGDGKGDLAGLVQRLDYLNDGVPGAGDDLEVDGLWLMPIFESPSYHGYDTVDYRAIDAEYGDRADFDALVAACEARGMKVVLDLVMNHTGEGHPWFQAAKLPTDPRRDWYVWRDDDPGWKQPFGSGDVWHPFGGRYYYGIFTGSMPDLNYRTAAVRAEMTDVAREWLGAGAAGFRLDAARYLVESEAGALFEQPETHAFWKELRAALEAAAPDADPYLVGEVWTGRSAVKTYFGEGDELHQAFDFDLQAGIKNAIDKGASTWLRTEISQQKSSGVPWSYSATFLSNHDLDRLSLDLDDSQQRAAAIVLMTLPGTPYLYYGDELGLRPSPAIGDPAKRGPMPWTADATTKHGFTSGTPWLAFGDEAATRNVASALADPQSLARTYQQLIRLRRAHPALAGPGITVVSAGQASLFVALRYEEAAPVPPAERRVYLVAVQLGDADLGAQTVDLSSNVALLGQGPWNMEPVFGQDTARLVTDPSAVSLGDGWSAHEGRVWELK